MSSVTYRDCTVDSCVWLFGSHPFKRILRIKVILVNYVILRTVGNIVKIENPDSEIEVVDCHG